MPGTSGDPVGVGVFYERGTSVNLECMLGEAGAEREIFIDNLLVRVHWLIEMIVVERPCAMGV